MMVRVEIESDGDQTDLCCCVELHSLDNGGFCSALCSVLVLLREESAPASARTDSSSRARFALVPTPHRARSLHATFPEKKLKTKI